MTQLIRQKNAHHAEEPLKAASRSIWGLFVSRSNS
jgi:hypothetical protein